MSYKIINRPAVAEDLINVVNYYKQISPPLTRQFIFRIREAKAYIARHPAGFQIKYKKVRTLLLKQFPYHIHYLVDEENKQIIILAVVHAYKNPLDFSGR